MPPENKKAPSTPPNPGAKRPKPAAHQGGGKKFSSPTDPSSNATSSNATSSPTTSSPATSSTPPVARYRTQHKKDN